MAIPKSEFGLKIMASSSGTQRKYKGNEPSPKGLGYCAHSEKLDKVRKGKDGNTWIVSQTKSGTKR